MQKLAVDGKREGKDRDAIEGEVPYFLPRRHV